MISVVIATKNRSAQLLACVQSLIKNNLKLNEILIADQSDEPDIFLQEYIKKEINIHYFHLLSTGKSTALNFIIQKTKGDIIAFTDDDCVLSSSWLSSITYFFRFHKNISGVFGRVLPYQPSRFYNMFCPCTYTKMRRKTFNKPIYHAAYIGYGNNMAFRRKVFRDNTIFKKWLGPGSIGLAANDAGITLQLLIKGFTLAYEPSILAYHNKWLTKKEMDQQALFYSSGEMACYGYFHFQGHTFATSIIRNNITDSFNKIKAIFTNILILRWNRINIYGVPQIIMEISYRSRGLLIGFIYSLVDPIR